MSGIELAGTDIGSPALAGSTVAVAGGYEIVAGGRDIWGESDEFHFAQEPVIGDFDLQIRLVSLDMAHDYSKAGIMARESLDPGSRHVFFLAFPDNRPRNQNNGGLEFQYRGRPDWMSSAIYPSDCKTEPPAFAVTFPDTRLRLTRVGDRFRAFLWISKGEWKLYCAMTLRMRPTLHVGLAVTSHNPERSVRAGFRDPALLPTVADDAKGGSIW
jgi:regulation of enolase protein 1 (concanavalin A-like superfamily)